MGAVEPTMASVGIEIGDSATRIAATVQGSSSARRSVRLAAPPAPDDALNHIIALIKGLLPDEGHTLGSVGVAVWGRVVVSSGTILDLPLNPDWAEYPLAERLADRLHIPVRVASAVEAAARAEAAQLGDRRRMLFCHASRSILSCSIRDGHSLPGAHARDGQLGHLRVAMDGPRCSCGQYGHLDAIGSGQSIVRTYIGRASASAESEAAMHRASKGRAEAITVGQIAALAAEGDPVGQSVFGEAAEGWAEALATAQVLYDAANVVISGSLTTAGELFLARVGSLLNTKLPAVAVPPRLLYALRPLDGALLGACLLAANVPRG